MTNRLGTRIAKLAQRMIVEPLEVRVTRWIIRPDGVLVAIHDGDGKRPPTPAETLAWHAEAKRLGVPFAYADDDPRSQPPAPLPSDVTPTLGGSA